MKLLDIDFKKKGVFYHQICRTNYVESANFATYKLKYSQNGPTIGFDVVTIQGMPERPIPPNFANSISNAGKLTIPAHEYYPWQELWGSKAWSFDHLKTALAKYDNIRQEELK